MDSRKHFSRAIFFDSPQVRHAAIAVLAIAGATLSSYLAAYQYDVVAHVWDPVFGSGSERVLNHDFLASLSKGWGLAIHDALLGAAAYAVEAILALAIIRWHASTTLLWGYTALVSLLAITGLLLVVLQGAIVGSWCLLCLTSAAISAIVLSLSYREVAVSFTAIVDWLRRAWGRWQSQHILGSK